MPNRVVVLLSLAALLLPGRTAAQSFDPAEMALFRALRRQPTALARYGYLDKAIPRLSPNDRIVALQLLSSAECELGLYDQAVLGFPVKIRTPQGLILPSPSEWRTGEAVDAIARLAADRRIVMINEAHHDAHTRTLTLALLPRLRALGFNYFAAEALVDTDPALQRRGYPTRATGTEYLGDPVYGEIVREAVRLGFTIVPYDPDSNVSTQAREIGQADTLYRKVFARDPRARLFVHAGYAHIDKARGRLGDIEPMAMRLKALTGFDPLSIDQTQFLETGWDRTDDYHRLIARFHPKAPVVLIDRASGKLWSARPRLYDANVILPPSASLKSFGDTDSINGEAIEDVSDPSRLMLGSLTAVNAMPRPKWLTLGGLRHPFPISAALCRTHLPCTVEAQYAGESDDAVAADRYAFMKGNAISTLYLFPGRYRLRSLDAKGKTLNVRSIAVDAPRADTSPAGRQSARPLPAAGGTGHDGR